MTSSFHHTKHFIINLTKTEGNAVNFPPTEVMVNMLLYKLMLVLGYVTGCLSEIGE